MSGARNVDLEETLHDALDSLGISSRPAPACHGRRQLTLQGGVAFGDPVCASTGWALVMLLRHGHPLTEHTLRSALQTATLEIMGALPAHM